MVALCPAGSENHKTHLHRTLPFRTSVWQTTTDTHLQPQRGSGRRTNIPQPIADYINGLHKTMELAKAAAEATEEQTKAKSKAYKDSRNKAKESVLQPGTSVLCFEPSKKKGLSASWKGPYTVTKRLGQLTYLIDIGGGKTWRRHRNAHKPYTATLPQ